MLGQPSSRIYRTEFQGELRPMGMEAKYLGQPNDNRFSLSGTCPHCSKPSVFMMITNAHGESVCNAGNQITHVDLWAGMQCQGCLKYMLACVRRQLHPLSLQPPHWYVAHYPVGKADDEVATEIPPHIAADFREGLRCRFVDAYNATVEMCRRAVQAS